MPNSLREPHEFIRIQADEQNLPRGAALCAIATRMFDFFENAEHQERNNGRIIPISDIDQYARQTAEARIVRNLAQAHQEFGADALDPHDAGDRTSNTDRN